MHNLDHHADGTHSRDVRWQVTTRAGVTFVCHVCITDGKIDVRLTTADELVCATQSSSLEAAAAVARRWLHVVLENQGVSEGLAGNVVDVVH